MKQPATYAFIDSQNDGDFLELYDYIAEKGKLLRVVVPNSFAYSRLLKENYRQQITFVNTDLRCLLKNKLGQNKTGQVCRSDKSLGLSGHHDNSIVANHASKVNSLRQKSYAKGVEK
jgi:hypothetical protein